LNEDRISKKTIEDRITVARKPHQTTRATGKPKKPELESRQVLGIIVKSIIEKKGRDVVALDLRELTTITEYFVICSGSSSIHTRAIAEHVEESCKREGIRPLGIEGFDVGKWILIDYCDIVVHIFMDETRWFYDLERLWGDAGRVDLESK